jgi:excisionase family DNA binding protein
MARRKRKSGERRAAQQRQGFAPPGLERLFTIDQIAQLGGPCRAKLYDDIKLGRLRAIKFGRSTRISESAYRQYIDSAPTLAPLGPSAEGHDDR